MSNELIEATVGQLVVERPSRARVFEKFGIDYCCGGRMPLREAIVARGLSADAVVEELAREASGSAPAANAAERDWATASLTDLSNHIEQTHHAYLKIELPRIEQLIARVCNRHGDRNPHLMELARVFAPFKDELVHHMLKEERVLFPLCRQLDTSETRPAAPGGTIGNPIQRMIEEHDDAGNALARFRELTNGYVPPADACNTYRALFQALAELEQDMHQHVHKENNILFPKALRAERLLAH